MSIDFAILIEPVARRLLGEPNSQLSTKNDLRWGNKGSFSVDIKKGIWFDHEAKQGGGCLDLIQRHFAGNPLDWLRSEKLIDATERKIAYRFCDENDVVLFREIRVETTDTGKRIRSHFERADGNGGWTKGKGALKDARRVLFRLRELIQAPPDQPVFIVEGPKKVDALYAIGLIATCNPGGAGMGWLKGYNEFFRDRDVIILPDNDVSGQHLSDKIARNLAGVARRVRVLALPDLKPKGDVIDWLGAGGTKDNLLGLVETTATWEETRSGTPEDGGHHERQNELAELDEQYCVVRVGGKTRVMWFEHEAERWVARYASFADFSNYHCNRKIIVPNKKGMPTDISLGQLWLASPERPTFSGITFQPNKPSIVEGKKNLWRGWGVEPAPGDWSLMRAHIKAIIAANNETFDRYVIHWTAFAFQHPDQPAGVALVLRSDEEGTGKGTFARALCKIFGQHALQISDSRYLTGNFNAHLQDCGLLFADEAFWPGDKSAEGTLKRIITEPSLVIEPKGIDPYAVPNCLHLIMSSNQEWVVPVSMSGRRFAVGDVSNERQNDRPYFKALRAEIDNGGLAAMLYDLLHLDLSSFDIFDFPRTEALIEQKVLSLEPFDQWWVGLLEEGRLPQFGNIENNPRRALTTSLLEDAKRKVAGMKYWSDVSFGRKLSKYGCTSFKETAGPRGWEFPPLAEARAEWERKAGGWSWNTEASEWEFAATMGGF
jgi:hypothetical protein